MSDADPSGSPRRTRSRTVATAIALVLAVALPLLLMEDGAPARAAAIAAACLVLWLLEAVPPHVPTLLLLVVVPLVLGPMGAQFRIPGVLTWGADPVLALFFGGFALGLAAQRHGTAQRRSVARLPEAA